ncbi:MAG: thioredoxin [Candidatus Bathyarchaeia archaeon]|nr:thioredoxin [Candidatus Bathyarchaeota archaeon]
MSEDDEEIERIRRRKIEKIMRDKASVSIQKTNTPVEVTDSNFNEVIKSSRVVVIDCWAQWCAPCRMMAPIVDELSREYAGKVLFGKLNVDENQRIPAEYQVMSIPTFLIFREGMLVGRIVGAMPKKALEQKLAQYLQV